MSCHQFIWIFSNQNINRLKGTVLYGTIIFKNKVVFLLKSTISHSGKWERKLCDNVLELAMPMKNRKINTAIVCRYVFACIRDRMVKCGPRSLRPFCALRQPVQVTVLRGAFFYLLKGAKHMNLKYTCPSYGTPLCYDQLCWTCKSDQERKTVLSWSPEQIKEKQNTLIRNIQWLADMENLELIDFWKMLSYRDTITPEI